MLPEYDLEQYVTKEALISEIGELQGEIAATASAEPDLSLYETKANADARQASLTSSLNTKATHSDVSDVRDLIPDVSNYATFDDVTNSNQQHHD